MKTRKKYSPDKSNETYASLLPWLPLSKRDFDRRLINKYMEPVLKRFIQ